MASHRKRSHSLIFQPVTKLPSKTLLGVTFTLTNLQSENSFLVGAYCASHGCILGGESY